MDVDRIIKKFTVLMYEAKLNQARLLIRKYSRNKVDELAEKLFHLGFLHGSLQIYDLAIFCLDLSMKTSRDVRLKEKATEYLVAALNLRANLHTRAGLFQEAEIDYKRAVSLNHNSSETYNNYAILLRKMGRFKEARDQYKIALEKKPDDHEVHSNLAILLVRMGDLEGAEEHLEGPLRAGYFPAQLTYSSILIERSKYKEAEDFLYVILKAHPEEPRVLANLGVAMFAQGILDESMGWFLQARENFIRENSVRDAVAVEAYADWITARKSWESFSFSREDTHSYLEEAQRYYREAAAKFRETNLLKFAFILEFISKAIPISKEYLHSLNSKTLAEMRDRMNTIRERFLSLYEEIKKISFPDVDLLKAQFICIDTLIKCLNLEDVHTADLHEATDIFGTYNFREPLQATTALENVANEFKILKKLYRIVEEIIQEKQEELLRMMKPFSVYDSIVTKRMDELMREKSITPYELREIIREEVLPIVRASETRIISKFETGFENYYHKLVQELEALTDAQLLKIKKVISEVIEEEIEKVEDQEKKKTLRSGKRAYDMAMDAISILGALASIYSVLITRPEEAMNEVARIVSIALSIIKKSSDMV